MVRFSQRILWLRLITGIAVMTIPLLNFILFDYYYIADIYGNSYFANILDLEKDVRKNLYFKPFCILCAFYNP